MVVNTTQHRGRVILAVAAMTFSLFSSTAAFAAIHNYVLSGAVFDRFPGNSITQTVAGTWGVNYATHEITALSLVAAGTETLNFELAGLQRFTQTNSSGFDQYEMLLKSTTGSRFFLNWQSSGPLAVIEFSRSFYSSNLYNTGGAFSGLTDPGTLREVSVVPEPTTWAMMVGGFGLLGLALRRRNVLVAA